MKRYNKLRKKYQKRLKKAVKTALPFDYGYGLDIFICFLEYMLEYYETQENVIGSLLEDLGTERDTRVDKIREALREYNLYLTAWDDFKSESGEVDREYSPTLIFRLLSYSHGKTTSHNEEQLVAYANKEKQHWDNFWNIVRDNIADWWD